jgi:Flp pilus assembly protein TadB
MLDAVHAGSLAAGLLCGAAVIAMGFGPPRIEPRRLLGPIRIAAVRSWLGNGIERAGWRETPERLGALAAALAACVATAAAAVAPLLAPVGFILGIGLAAQALRSAVERRRRRMVGELVPLLELFTLELSAGGSALSALGSVTVQVEGELASELRRMLIASQVNGSQSFEARLLDYSERIRIPALGSLATILGANRDFGTGASQGVRALATDLRRAQRRDLITHSRTALNHVLLPAAVGVLLPFLGVLMFPAVSVLQRSLH